MVFPRFLSALLGNWKKNFLSEKRPHCLLHTHPSLQLQWDLFHSYYSSCLYHRRIVGFQCVVSAGQKLHLRREASRRITSLLSATMISSTYLVVFWACLLCCDKNKDGKNLTVIRKCVEDQDTISVISYRFYLKDLRWTFKNCNS